MSDRTGGMLPGVFEKAVGKVNLLQPEFVLSVGDLIDGYTENATVWNTQWDEFMAIVDRLEMPFFFVPGNHDISNASLLEVWKQRLGPPFYHFVYKDVLFIALHTEDGPLNTSGISLNQAAYVDSVLADHSNVRWTMIFMHRPLWSYSNQLGYDRIEKALGERPYTVFSGHHHHYLHSKHNGRDHFVLATTGGGSYLRGVEFGEFEHITWVTMKDDGPVVAHIEIDNIHDKAIVTDDSYSLVQTLRNGDWLIAEPVILESNGQLSVTAKLNVKNGTDSVMSISGFLEPANGLQFSPKAIEKRVMPGEVVPLFIEILSENGLQQHALNESDLEIELKASFNVDGKSIGLNTSRRLLFDTKHQLKKTTSKIVLDGFVNEWEKECFIHVTNPVYMHEDWDWNGSGDGQFRFCVQLDDEWVYVAIDAQDDRIIVPDRTAFSRLQDQFYVNIDAYAPENRRTDIPARLYGSMPVPNDVYFQIRVAPGIDANNALLETNFTNFEVRSAAQVDESRSSIVAELAFPVSAIQSKQGLDWSSIRLNVGWMDHDRPENSKPSILWWRPVWGQPADHPNLGTWYRY
jgi:hypothetical protein